MNDNKAKQIELKQSFDIDYMNILYEDETVSIVDVLVLHEGVNRNKSNLSHDVIVAALPSLANKPVWAIPNETIFKDSANDFVEHARTESDKNNIMIFGTFPESGVNAAEFVDIDGKTYLKVQAVLWKMYAPIAMSILKNRNGTAKISIEINVIGTQDDDGILNVSKMQFLSATVLGATILEGIEGSSLNIVRYSLDKTIQESQEHYSKFITNSQNKLYEIPESIKEKVNQGIKLKNSLGHNGISNDIVMANFIVKNKYISNDKLNYFENYFNKNIYSKENNISWLLHGGDEAKNWIREVNNLEKEVFVSKDEIGSKDKITIDKSKDSLSDGAWSDKGIRATCLEASNWKAVCKAVFLKLEDGWEDGTEGKLGYPVMEKTGSKVIYNRKGLASAKGYAEKNNETAVLTSLKAIYKHLELPWDVNSDFDSTKDTKKEDGETIMKNKAIEKFSLTSNQIHDILQNAFAEFKYKCGDRGNCNKYWVCDYDDNLVYVDDYEENKYFSIPYTIVNEVATVDMSKKAEVISGGWKSVGDGSTVVTNADNDKKDVAKIEKNDDGQSDTDDVEDFKAKYKSLVTERDDLKNKLADYEAKEKKVADEKKMSELLNTYAHCYSDEEKIKAEESIKNSTYEDFAKSVDDQIKSFALKMKDVSVKPKDDKSDTKDDSKADDKNTDDEKDSKDIKKNSFNFSISPFGVTPTYDFSKQSEDGLKGIIEKSGVKFK